MRRTTIYKTLILLFALSLVMLTLSSCRLDIMTDIMDGYDSNPFLDRKMLDSTRQGDDEITFLLFSDAHLNRKNEDSWAEDNTPYLKDFLCKNKNDYDFVISLGDIEDAGDINAPELHEFLKFFRNNGITYLSALGNHELQSFHERSEWNDLYSSYGLFGTVGCYTYGDLSIYVTDSTKRIYGRQQLSWLEEALACDNSRYKIMITHVNTYSGGTFDSSILFFGTADIAERNEIYRMMTKYGVSVLFNGHFHTENIRSNHSTYVSEFNAAALHSRELIKGWYTPGYFYTCTIDSNASQLIMDTWKIERGKISEEKSESFALRDGMN